MAGGSNKIAKADIAVIGAGSGGLSVAAGAAMLGLDVVLFEKGEMGGDCLNYGCVPSKALIAASRQAQAMRESGRYGVAAQEPEIDWLGVRAHVERAIDAIAPVDSQERFESLGVRVVRESAAFVDRRTVASRSLTVRPRRIVVATGSRAAIPPIPGLSDTPYLTNETVFSLSERPSHLIILGGGPIGVELGQAFARLGAKVTIVDRGRVLSRAEPEHAAIVIARMRAEGVDVIENMAATSVRKTGEGVEVTIGDEAAKTVLAGSHLLVAVGRRPSLDGLGLDVGGVDTDSRGIVTKANLRSTSNSRVWAVGDVAGRGQFTHLAGWHASVFVRNALFKARSRAADLPLPAVTYCEPELAQVGLTPEEAVRRHGPHVKVVEFPFSENDRAIAEGATLGGARLATDKKGAILGASIVGDGAGDIVQIVGFAMSNGMKIRALTNFISPYPTRAEVLKRAASKWYEPIVFGPAMKRLAGLLQQIP